MDRWGGERIFPVPAWGDPDEKVAMKAHLKTRVAAASSRRAPSRTAIDRAMHMGGWWATAPAGQPAPAVSVGERPRPPSRSSRRSRPLRSPAR
ncbi:hypothetical protein, partial [Streptomyces sp. LS1784]|uniref:hypothetical protein n=1 Tax=Streptomyces sp. LS1784 TaxID=2851533 RepID=UPI001CCE7F1A